jgi:hypothetical protein
MIRYHTDSISEVQAKDFFDAVIDENEGILKWLENYW